MPIFLSGSNDEIVNSDTFKDMQKEFQTIATKIKSGVGGGPDVFITSGSYSSGGISLKLRSIPPGVSRSITATGIPTKNQTATASATTFSGTLMTPAGVASSVTCKKDFSTMAMHIKGSIVVSGGMTAKAVTAQSCTAPSISAKNVATTDLESSLHSQTIDAKTAITFTHMTAKSAGPPNSIALVTDGAVFGRSVTAGTVNCAPLMDMKNIADIRRLEAKKGLTVTMLNTSALHVAAVTLNGVKFPAFAPGFLSHATTGKLSWKTQPGDTAITHGVMNGGKTLLLDGSIAVTGFPFEHITSTTHATTFAKSVSCKSLSATAVTAKSLAATGAVTSQTFLSTGSAACNSLSVTGATTLSAGSTFQSLSCSGAATARGVKCAALNVSKKLSAQDTSCLILSTHLLTSDSGTFTSFKVNKLSGPSARASTLKVDKAITASGQITGGLIVSTTAALGLIKIKAISIPAEPATTSFLAWHNARKNMEWSTPAAVADKALSGGTLTGTTLTLNRTDGVDVKITGLPTHHQSATSIATTFAKNVHAATLVAEKHAKMTGGITVAQKSTISGTLKGSTFATTKLNTGSIASATTMKATTISAQGTGLRTKDRLTARSTTAPAITVGTYCVAPSLSAATISASAAVTAGHVSATTLVAAKGITASKSVAATTVTAVTMNCSKASHAATCVAATLSIAKAAASTFKDSTSDQYLAVVRGAAATWSFISAVNDNYYFDAKFRKDKLTFERQDRGAAITIGGFPTLHQTGDKNATTFAQKMIATTVDARGIKAGFLPTALTISGKANVKAITAKAATFAALSVASTRASFTVQAGALFTTGHLTAAGTSIGSKAVTSRSIYARAITSSSKLTATTGTCKNLAVTSKADTKHTTCAAITATGVTLASGKLNISKAMHTTAVTATTAAVGTLSAAKFLAITSTLNAVSVTAAAKVHATTALKVGGNNALLAHPSTGPFLLTNNAGAYKWDIRATHIPSSASSIAFTPVPKWMGSGARTATTTATAGAFSLKTQTANNLGTAGTLDTKLVDGNKAANSAWKANAAYGSTATAQITVEFHEPYMLNEFTFWSAKFPNIMKVKIEGGASLAKMHVLNDDTKNQNIRSAAVAWVEGAQHMFTLRCTTNVQNYKVYRITFGETGWSAFTLTELEFASRASYIPDIILSAKSLTMNNLNAKGVRTTAAHTLVAVTADSAACFDVNSKGYDLSVYSTTGTMITGGIKLTKGSKSGSCLALTYKNIGGFTGCDRVVLDNAHYNGNVYSIHYPLDIVAFPAGQVLYLVAPTTTHGQSIAAAPVGSAGLKHGNMTASGNARPTAGTRNGKSYFLFDGANQIMTGPGAPAGLAQSKTVFVVWREDPPYKAYGNWAAFGDNTGHSSANIKANSEWLYNAGDASQTWIGAGAVGTACYMAVYDLNSNTSEPIVEAKTKGELINLRRYHLAKDCILIWQFVGTNKTHVKTLGGESASARLSKCAIYEISAYTTTFTGAERLAEVRNIRKRWAL